MNFTAAQFRASRALLGVSQAKVASEIKVSEQTVKRMERDDMGPMKSQASTAFRARDYFESQGVVFMDVGDGFCSGVALRTETDEPGLPGIGREPSQ